MLFICSINELQNDCWLFVFVFFFSVADEHGLEPIWGVYNSVIELSFFRISIPFHTTMYLALERIFIIWNLVVKYMLKKSIEQKHAELVKLVDYLYHHASAV